MASPPKDNSPLQVVVDAFWRAAIDPNSQAFLPTLVQGQQNPAYEPFAVTQWDPVNLTDASETAALVCSNESTLTVNYMAPPDTPPAITFSDVVIQGISNVVPDPMTVDSDTVTATARFSSYPSSVAPQPITITGDFVLTQQCCPTEKFIVCSRPAQPFTGSGTFTVSIVSSTVTATVLLTGDDELVATVQSLQWSASQDPSNMTASVDITSIPPGPQRDQWNQYAQESFDSVDARSGLVANVQAALSAQSTLDSLGTLITGAIASLFTASQQGHRKQ